MVQKVMIVIVAAVVLSGCGVFEEHDRDKNAALLQSKVSLADAIGIAERNSGGKAIRAGAEEEDGAVLIMVLTAQRNKVQKVFIDPQTGAIVKSRSEEDND